MGNGRSAMIAAILRYLKDDDANVAIETLLWFPVYLAIAAVFVDTSSFVMAQSRMHNAAAEGARLVAVGRMTEVEAEAYMANFATGSEVYSADIVVGEFAVTATVRMNFANLMGLGLLAQQSGSFGSEAHFYIDA